MQSGYIQPLIVLCALTCGFLSQNLSLVQRLDNLQYDYFHRWSGIRHQAKYTVLVTVSKQQLPGEADRPLLFWGSRYAKIIEKLRQAGVAAIGLDYLPHFSAESGLSELPKTAQTAAAERYDQPLQRQLLIGNIVMPSLITSDRQGVIAEDRPQQDYVLPLLASGKGYLGPANLDINLNDGIIRNHIINFSNSEEKPRYAFAASLVKMAGIEISPVSIPQPIGYLGPPDTIPRITRHQLIRAGPEDSLLTNLKGKIAIIGADYPGNQDLHNTPYGEMIGAEIHAQIVETLISNRYPQTIHDWKNIIIALGAVLIAMPLFQRLSPWQNILLLPITLAGLSLLAYAAFLFDLRMAATVAQSSIILTYLASVALRFTQQEKARRHIYSLLSRYVSEPVAKRISKSEQLPELGGETIEVTVLFSDIRGFTTLSEKLTPVEVVEVLNHYFSEVCSIVIENGGAIDKFIGDALMAVFGAPEANAHHAELALNTANKMQQKAQHFDDWLQKQFPDRNLAPFQIGVGLHTGSVVAGNIGSNVRMDYTVIGDAVNVASRLEGQCKALGWPIVASRETLLAAGENGAISEWIELHVKGRDEAVYVGYWQAVD